jgi:MazG family protein
MVSAKHYKEFADLYEIIKRLRGPNGCPWDQKQSPESIKKYLQEETKELFDAISHDDDQHICEEIGDLFFILLLIIRMYEEDDHFTVHDVLSGITAKMTRRHPHVFAGMEAAGDSELKQQWESLKALEKKKS